MIGDRSLEELALSEGRTSNAFAGSARRRLRRTSIPCPRGVRRFQKRQHMCFLAQIEAEQDPKAPSIFFHFLPFLSANRALSMRCAGDRAKKKIHRPFPARAVSDLAQVGRGNPKAPWSIDPLSGQFYVSDGRVERQTPSLALGVTADLQRLRRPTGQSPFVRSMRAGRSSKLRPHNKANSGRPRPMRPGLGIPLDPIIETDYYGIELFVHCLFSRVMLSFNSRSSSLSKLEVPLTDNILISLSFIFLARNTNSNEINDLTFKSDRLLGPNADTRRERWNVGDRPESTYCGRSRPRPWTHQFGRICDGPLPIDVLRKRTLTAPSRPVP